MEKFLSDQIYRGFLQSKDGVVSKILDADAQTITFEAIFGLSQPLIERLKAQPEHLIFSERSRIARLGVQISCSDPKVDYLEKDNIVLRLNASSVIPGYPGLNVLKDFFTTGLPIGRLVFCDPQALLSSGQVIEAIDKSELKLPESTTISSGGSILIAPHKVMCVLREPLDKETLGRILFRGDGREILNRHQVREEVSKITIPAGEGIITTCSMFLNDHYVVLQSESDRFLELGSHLPATILDPIKTRGIRIYLEIVNGSKHPIVNPLISAKIYKPPKIKKSYPVKKASKDRIIYSYKELGKLKKRFDDTKPSTCHFLNKPVALIVNGTKDTSKAKIFLNGPKKPCKITKAVCATARHDFSSKSECPHEYATSRIKDTIPDKPSTIIMKYFPNSLEHHDIIDLVSEEKIDSLYFYEPSWEYGPFLSQFDHNRLQEYHAFGLNIFWVSGLSGRLMTHTIRDGKGYFVAPDRLAAFHKSMLFAFYGSNQALSKEGMKLLDELMKALISFWGKNIGIVTGGGSGVMEAANNLAHEHNILSGANFLDITDQPMMTDVDFCQVFQSSCRHSRQKWFEVASFPIFNVGGLGSLEELGITLCNMKLSILEPVPVILFDTESSGYWEGIENQIKEMVRRKRAPDWIEDNIIITSDPKEVIKAYCDRLRLF